MLNLFSFLFYFYETNGTHVLCCCILSLTTRALTHTDRTHRQGSAFSVIKQQAIEAAASHLFHFRLVESDAKKKKETVTALIDHLSAISFLFKSATN